MAAPEGDHLVGVDSLVRLFPGQFGDESLHGRHPGRSTNQDHVIDVGGLDACVLHSLLERRTGPLYEILGELVELGPGQLLEQVDGAFVSGGDEG